MATTLSIRAEPRSLACSEQRALREEAAKEMARRARLSQAAGPAASFMQADNAIDAVASGEDLTTVLSPGELLSMKLQYLSLASNYTRLCPAAEVRKYHK